MNLKSLKDLLDRPIAFHRIFVTWTGSVNAAVFLSQLFYWHGRASDIDGWIYKTAEDWEEETGLSRKEQATVRRVLREKGLVEERLKGIPATLHFRLCESTVCSFAQSAKLASPNGESRLRPTGEPITETLHRPHRQRRKADAGTERSGFDLEEEEVTPMMAFARSFAKWSVKNKLHALQRGSTKMGWKPATVKAWARLAQALLDSLGGDVERLQRAWKWYQQHYGEDFVPECRTLKSFCERFLSVEASMRRASRPPNRKAQDAQEEENIGTGERITDEFFMRQGIDPSTVKRRAVYRPGDEL